MFEYFASRTPVVSNLPCNYDIIEHYNAKETVKPDSPEALAEGLLKYERMYREDRESYEEICENAAKAAKDFDFPVLTDMLEKALS